MDVTESARKPFASVAPLVAAILRAQCVWILGSGASEVVAHKFAHTLRTIGFRAISMSAETMFHGDAGGVQEADLVLYVSRGARQDLLQ